MFSPLQSTKAIQIFFSYAREDEQLRNEVVKQLILLERQHIITHWHDCNISAGKDWVHEINEHLNAADIILLLISSDFMATDYCYRLEMQRALERHEAGETRVIPIILRPVDWHSAPFGKLHALPQNGVPVTLWINQEEALLDVARGIREVVESIIAEQASDRSSSRLLKPASPKRRSDFPAIWNVPYERNPFFTGREVTLLKLHSALDAANAIPLMRRQAISGLGGIGKTQIAIEYAYRYSHEYRTILWARAESREGLISDFTTIASVLDLAEKNTADQQSLIRAVMRWFQDHVDWLLILDNADDLAMVKDLRPSGEGHTILTTCAQATGDVAHCVAIEKMEIEEGMLFLLHRAGILSLERGLNEAFSADLKYAKEIVEALYAVPLALDQAAAYIEETGCGLSNYLQLYRKYQRTLLKRRGELASDHPQPIATTWSMSFEKAKKTNSAAADLLCLCSFLDPDAIPEEIVVEALIDHHSVAQSTTDLIKLNEAIKELRKYSLVQRDPDHEILSVHRLVQAVLKEEMSEEVQRVWAERVVRAVNKVFPDVEYSTWPLCQRYLLHAQACADLIIRWNMVFPEAVRLLIQTAYYFYERAQCTEAEVLYQRAVEAIENVLGPEHPDLERSLKDLGNVYNSQGKYELAERLYLRILTLQETVWHAELPELANTFCELGVLHRRQGKYDQAELYLRRSLSIREKVSGPEHARVAAHLLDLGILEWLRRRDDQAEYYIQRSLTIREKLLSPDHPDLARSLSALGTVYNSQGKYEQAELYLKQALEIQERIWGSEHPDISISLNELGQLCRKQGKYAQAEQYFRKALLIREKLLESGHPDVAMSLGNLARLLRETNREDEAVKLDMRIQNKK